MQLLEHQERRDVYGDCPCGHLHSAPKGLPPFCHVAEVKRRGETAECDIKESSWPYPCDAQDYWPGDRVWTCLTHSCWGYGPASADEPAATRGETPGAPSPSQEGAQE